MSLIQWILVGVLIVIVAAAIEAYLRRNRSKRSLAEIFGAEDNTETGKTDVPLGMEATDLDMVREAEQGNRMAETRSSHFRD